MSLKKLLCLSLAMLMIIGVSVGYAQTLDDYRTKKIGVTTASYSATVSKNIFPEGDIYEYSSIADTLLALTQGKVDIYLTDESLYTCAKWEGQNFDRLAEPYETSDYGMAFRKGVHEDLREQLNEFIAKIKENGEYAVLQKKWFGDQEPTEFADPDSLTGDSGVLRVVVCNEAKPFGYIKNNKLVGYDVDFIVAFAREYGYTLKVEGVAFPAVLSGLQTGMYDFAASGLTITKERRETMDFTDVYHQEDLIFMIRGEEDAKAAGDASGKAWIDSLKISFEKTFIREQRWKLIVQGVCTTLIISVFSVLGGTLLGFALYMLARSQTKWLSNLTRSVCNVYSAIIAGTPTLVVLMLLFYVVFTSPDVSGVAVAIIGFILTFGSFVYNSLDLAVSSVDRGQTEAAFALGYSRNQTFLKIILPQAMKMFVPGYSSEIVSLVKATAVVGYIAVNDLTKVGDIIRGNTYEAFFPLIAVAVIYFAITWIITQGLGVLKKKTEPKRRKNENILRGVKR